MHSWCLLNAKEQRFNFEICKLLLKVHLKAKVEASIFMVCFFHFMPYKEFLWHLVLFKFLQLQGMLISVMILDGMSSEDLRKSFLKP